MDEILKHDQNSIRVLAGVTDDADQDIRMLRVDPITKRLLVDASGTFGNQDLQSVTDNGATTTVASTFSTSITTPLLIGGTGTTSDLILRTTSGVGATGADMIFQGGNNGATEFARFLNDGNFAIGRTSTLDKVEVYSQTIGAGLRIDGAGNGSYLWLAGGNQALSTVNKAGIVVANGNFGRGNMYFLLDDSTDGNNANITDNTKMMIDYATGNVGIGTNTPLGKLDVSGSSSSTNLVTFDANRSISVINTNTTANNAQGIVFRSQSTNGTMQSGVKLLGVNTGRTTTGLTTDLAILTNVNGTISEKMRLTSAGRLGVGTTAPDQLLHISGASARMKIQATSGDPVLELAGSAFTNFIFVNNTDGGTYIRTDSASRHVLLQAGGTQGNVGIGTTTTSAKLHTVATTEQLRLGYDSSNYWNATTSSTGVTTFNAVGSGASFIFSDDVIAKARIESFQGTDVASANNLVLGLGNVFEITGTTQINLISNLSWQNGSQVTLLFTSTPTVKHNQATSTTNITIQLAGAVDFVATDGDTLTLVLSEIGGVQAWREVSRAVI